MQTIVLSRYWNIFLTVRTVRGKITKDTYPLLVLTLSQMSIIKPQSSTVFISLVAFSIV